MASKKLSGKFLQHFEREFPGDRISNLLTYLRQSNQKNYGRNAIKDIKTAVSLFDYMSQKGDINLKEGKEDFTKLIEVIRDCELPEIAEELEELIKEHKGKDAAVDAAGADHFAAPAQKRPSQLSVQATDTVAYGKSSHSSTDSSIISPDGVASAKRYCYKQSSQVSNNSVFSDDGNDVNMNNGNSVQHKFFQSGSDYRYCVDSGSHQGLVAIINNFTNDQDSHYRKGTVEDEQALRRLFGVQLQGAYHVDSEHQNLRKREFENYLTDLANQLQQGNYSSFLLFILSHGEKEGVKTYYTDNDNQSDDHVIPVDEITAKFESVLPGKPRLIFIQACQGQTDNSPQSVESDSINTNRQIDREPDQEEVEGDDAQMDAAPPRAADMLTAFATIKGFRSYRNANSGTWFIKEFVDVITRSLAPRYYSTHIEDILTEVQSRVAVKVGKATPSGSDNTGTKISKVMVKQMPYYQSTLRKKFYIVPNPTLP